MARLIETAQTAFSSLPFSLLVEIGNLLLAGDALLSQKTVFVTHCSPNRRGPVGIVGIVVVHCPVIRCVANANIVGVTGVGSAENPNVPTPRSRIADSLFSI